MKRLGFYLLRIYLGFLAWVVIKRCQPIIIGIAGTTNKTFTKQAIEQAMIARNISTSSTVHNFNTDIGIPLTILDLPSGYNSYQRWLTIIPQAIVKAVRRSLPKVLVLELGISHPGDAEHLSDIIQPDILVITDITQRYRENFGDVNNLSKEYRKLIEKVSKKGLVVLNYDTMIVKDLEKYCQAKVLFFSVEDVGNSREDIYFIKNLQGTESGQKFEIVSPEKNLSIFIPRFGKHHLRSALVSQIVVDSIEKFIKP